MTNCEFFDECARASYAKGMCLMHYKRVWRGGTARRPKHRPHDSTPDQALRWRGWTVTPDACWEYNGRIVTSGYGQVDLRGRVYMAHRLAYEAWVKPIPTGLHVLHHCDNRRCINPEHLWVGTNQENVNDKMRKGRYWNGAGPRPEALDR